MGFGLVLRFTEHLQIITTSNYSANASSLQACTCTKSFQSAVSAPVIAW
jgi:hypothetical protein